MAVININSGGPEGKEREFGLTWSSDLPSVRKPYTRKAHIPEDDVVFKDAESSGVELFDIEAEFDPDTNIGGKGNINFRIVADSVQQVEGFSDFKNMLNIQKIYVPAELVDDYKEDSGWSEYSDIIFADPEEETVEDEPEETPSEP